MFLNMGLHLCPVIAGIVLEIFEVGIEIVIELKVWSHRNVADELL